MPPRVGLVRARVGGCSGQLAGAPTPFV